MFWKRVYTRVFYTPKVGDIVLTLEYPKGMKRIVQLDAHKTFTCSGPNGLTFDWTTKTVIFINRRKH